jgi:hypothetical protein
VGKTQTRMPWESWKKPYTYDWFHDVFHADGKPYLSAETELFVRLTSTPREGAGTR